MSKEKKVYSLICHRCHRPFTSTHNNAMYCDNPSPWPEDKGRTCKEMQRIDSKKRSIERDKQMKANLENGQIVYSTKYGFQDKNDWFNAFYAFLRKKYKFGTTYAETQRWIMAHPQEFSEEYDVFQKKCGMKTFNAEDFSEEEQQ